MTDLYPGATWRPSVIQHPSRPETLGVTIHWTAGAEAGDLATLDGPTVDVHLYVTKAGRVYQFLPLDSQAWHAKATANRYCLGIETEGRGEAWTPKQLASVARLTAWLCERYAIPVRHADPSGTVLETFRGIFGHRDLSLGGVRVDGNDHTDTVPDDTGWPRFLAEVASFAGATEHGRPAPPDSSSLRLAWQPRGREAMSAAGWARAAGPMRWMARNGLARDTKIAIAWRKSLWRYDPEREPGVVVITSPGGATRRVKGDARYVAGVVTSLTRRYL